MSDKKKKFDVKEAMDLLSNPLAQLEFTAFSVLMTQALENTVGDILEEAKICTKKEFSQRLSKQMETIQANLSKGIPKEESHQEKKKKEQDDLLKILQDLPDGAFGKVQ